MVKTNGQIYLSKWNLELLWFCTVKRRLFVCWVKRCFFIIEKLFQFKEWHFSYSLLKFEWHIVYCFCLFFFFLPEVWHNLTKSSCLTQKKRWQKLRLKLFSCLSFSCCSFLQRSTGVVCHSKSYLTAKRLSSWFSFTFHGPATFERASVYNK